MITIKGTTLVITGKDEKMVKQQAKKAGMSPKRLIVAALEAELKRTVHVGKDIIITKLT